MVDIGSVEMAKYPFLPDAGRHLQDPSFTIEKFGSDPDLKKIIEKAYDRIKLAVDGGVDKSEILEGYTLDMEVFSFLIATVLLKLGRSGALVNKFVMAESRRAEHYLESDLGDLRDTAKEYPATKIIEDLFSVSIERRGRDFVIPIQDYVRRSVFFHELPWKLVNRRVDGGKVFLNRHEVVRLIRQQLNRYIADRIQSAAQPPMLPNFEEPVRRLALLAKRFYTAPIVSVGYPPCIKHAIKELEDGKNLPHSGRFMLASYLLSRGTPVDEIVPLFKSAPDYNEKITRYQLNHIASGGDGTTGYVCPSCTKIKSNDLCFETAECRGITNPLQFGRRRTLYE